MKNLWNECLWDEYSVTRKADREFFFSRHDPRWRIRHVVSQARPNNLELQAQQAGIHLLSSARGKTIRREFSMPDVIGIAKRGRRQVLKLRDSDGPSEEIERTLYALIDAHQAYYEELLVEPHERLGGGSLKQLLRAWVIISNTAAVLEARAVESGTMLKEDAGPLQFMPPFTCAIDSRALEDALIRALAVGPDQAKRLLTFLTYTGSDQETLWTQPLVSMSERTVAPVLPAAIAPNVRRLVDEWLRQLGVDLGRRGPAFEAAVRRQWRQCADRSLHLRATQVIDRSFVFRPSHRREEQFDLVAVIGDVVIVGESKCILLPAEAKQNALHRKTVEEAASQVERKALAVKSAPQEFCSQLAEIGITIPKEFKVIPLVILNSAINAGIPMNGVPVVDQKIVEVFFVGSYGRKAEVDSRGKFRTLDENRLYDSFDTAKDVLAEYLHSPPQMENYKKAVAVRTIPVPAIDEKDWFAAYETFECVPTMPK